jgi:prefoldin subunit 5
MKRGRAGPPITLFSFQDIITSVTGIIILVALVLALELTLRKAGSPAAQTTALVQELQAAIDQSLGELEHMREQLESGGKVVAELAGSSPEQVVHELTDLGEQLQQLDEQLRTLTLREQEARQAETAAQARRFERRGDTQKLVDLRSRVAELKSDLEQLQTGHRWIYNPVSASGKQAWLIQVDGQLLLIAPVGRPQKPIEFSDSTPAARRTSLSRWCQTLSPQSDFLFLLVRPKGVEEFAPLEVELRAAGFDLGFDLLGEDQVAIDPLTGAAFE